MTFALFCEQVHGDLYRYAGGRGIGAFFSAYFTEPGFRFGFWLRLCRFLRDQPSTRFGFYHLAKLFFNHYRFKYGVHIDFMSEIGAGLYICHVGLIVINRRVIIGKNCNLSHEVTVGQKSRGKNEGTPVVGDNVYIGPGAKIIGGVTVGDNVAVGANCVVTRDVPQGSVVAGIPGKVISDGGSTGYVNLTV